MKEDIKDIFLTKTLPLLRSQATARAIEIAAGMVTDEEIRTEVDKTISEVIFDYVLNNNQPKKPLKCSLGSHDWKYLEPRDEKITWRICKGCFGRQRGRDYDGSTWWDWA